jgi:cysteine sulfinate desulfinase/cysteine desulfurase-like protein
VNPLYFDAHATTPCDPRVVAAMLPYFTERFGNASSAQHPFGWAAREAVESARGQVAALIGARPRDIVFTSGATESNNLAIAGAMRALRARGRHVVTIATEHTAVLDVCAALEGDGLADVTRLGVDAGGLVDPAAVEAAIRADTVLVSAMAANNEIGVLQPIAAIGAIARARGAAFHVDAAQAAGKVPLDVEAIGADLLSISAHKFYGPKGVGALYVRRRGPVADLPPLHHGGGHERGLRSGTLNVPGIVGCGAAADIARAAMADDAAAAAKPERPDRSRQRPRAADGAERPVAVVGRRLLHGERRAVARPEGHRPVRRGRPRLAPIRADPRHDRGRRRHRDRDDCRRRRGLAALVPRVRDSPTCSGRGIPPRCVPHRSCDPGAAPGIFVNASLIRGTRIPS